MSGCPSHNPDTVRVLTERCICDLNGVEIYTVQNVDLLTQHKWSSKKLFIYCFQHSNIVLGDVCSNCIWCASVFFIHWTYLEVLLVLM